MKTISLVLILLIPTIAFAEPPDELSKWPDKMIAWGTMTAVVVGSPPAEEASLPASFEFTISSADDWSCVVFAIQSDLTYRSYNSCTSATTSCTVTTPSGAVASDMLVGFCGADMSVTISKPDVNWTQIDHQVESGSSAITSAVFYRTGGTYDDPSQAAYHTFQEVATGATITTGSLTVVNGDLMLACYTNDDGDAVSAGPADMTLPASGWVVANSTVVSGCWYEESMTAGDYNKSLQVIGSDQMIGMGIRISN